MRLDLIRPPRLGLLDPRVGRSAASCDIRIGPDVCHQRRLCYGRSLYPAISRQIKRKGGRGGLRRKNPHPEVGLSRPQRSLPADLRAHQQ